MHEVKERQLRDKIIQAVITFVMVLTGLVLVFNCYYSFMYTQESVNGTEVFCQTNDTLFYNLMMIPIALCVAFIVNLIPRKEKAQILAERILLAVVLCLSFGIGLVWVRYAYIEPEADQKMLINIAGEVIMGRYDSLQPGGYLYMYPQQLGLVSVLSALYRLFGIFKYIAFTYINVACLPLVVLSGYQITKLISPKSNAVRVFLLLIIGCLPIYFYLPFIYGDICGLAFSLALIWNLLAFNRDYNIVNLVWGVIFASLAYEFKMNSAIILIAVVISLLFMLIQKFSWQPIVFAVAMIVAVGGLDIAVHEAYGSVAGVDDMRGMPKTLHVSMGLQDNKLGPGWFSYRGEEIFRDNKFDYATSAMVAQTDIWLRLREFQLDPAMAVDFFSRKASSQWNEPTYDSIVATNAFMFEEEAMPPLIVRIYRGDLLLYVVQFMNRYQIIIYFFTLYATITMICQKKELKDIVLCLIVVGGFLFSMLWEAKSRYILLYYVCMIPIASCGLTSCVGHFRALFHMFFSKESSPVEQNMNV